MKLKESTKDGRGKVSKKAMEEGKHLRVNVEKAKGLQLLYGKKAYVLKVGSCGFYKGLFITVLGGTKC